MSYKNIKQFVSSTTKKILYLWLVLFTINIGFFFAYNYLNNQVNFMKNQVLNFSEISNEITTVLYYNSQRNIASEVDYSKTLIPQWIKSHKEKFTKLLPNTIPETDILETLGNTFYSPENLNNKEKSIETFQDLSNQIGVLSRLVQNFINNSPIEWLSKIFIPINIGIMLILLVLSISFSNNLQKTIIQKNNFILEDIWHELQNHELNAVSPINHEEFDISDSIKEKIKKILEYTQTLSTQTTGTKNNLIVFAEHIQNINRSGENHLQEPIQQPDTPSHDIQEQVQMIQQLLSRLFTRSERAASLAKASSNNGFQAGILALNTSIEAAKIGEAGKNFIPISDKVKDFAEKSSQIGNAIIEELKDANLSIRKAYSIGKNLLENSSEHQNNNLRQTPVINSYNKINTSDLAFILEQYNTMFELIRHIQYLSQELESSTGFISNTQPNHSNTDHTIKETLLRSFERLYRLNYGTNPPSFDSNFFDKNI